MSKKPPGDEDPLLQEILRQIKDSFVDHDHNPFVDSEIFDVLSQEISSSIAALTSQEKSIDPPDMCVVEGGLLETTDHGGEAVENIDVQLQHNTTTQESPQLHIANPKDYGEAVERESAAQQIESDNRSEGVFSSLFSSEGSNVEVRVFGPDDFERLRSELSSKELEGGGCFKDDLEQPVGLIHLEAYESQLIFKGQEAKIYRVCSDQGEILIFKGEEEVTRVKAGQSCDVEGTELSVRAAEAKAEGWYSCIV